MKSEETGCRKLASWLWLCRPLMGGRDDAFYPAEDADRTSPPPSPGALNHRRIYSRLLKPWDLFGNRKATLFFFFFLNDYSVFILFILLMAVLGLRFWARAFSSCGERGPLSIAVRGPLTVAASLVAEHRLQTRRLSSCGSRAQLLRDMWDLPRPGLEPVSPALAGGFSTTAPPGKPRKATLDAAWNGPRRGPNF